MVKTAKQDISVPWGAIKHVAVGARAAPACRSCQRAGAVRVLLRRACQSYQGAWGRAP